MTKNWLYDVRYQLKASFGKKSSECLKGFPLRISKYFSSASRYASVCDVSRFSGFLLCSVLLVCLRRHINAKLKMYENQVNIQLKV